MSAIFGFTFHMGRMTEVLTPDIYRAHWWVVISLISKIWRTVMERATVIGQIQTTIDAIKITDFSRKKICLFAKQNSFKKHFDSFVSHFVI